METSQEHSFFNNHTTNSASDPEAEDPILRLSSSSSSSCSSFSCSSIEAEPRPDDYNNNNVDQSPPTQMMERSSTNNNSPSTPTYRIPAHVFETTASSAPGEWSTLSNESLFSIHIGNNSFSGEDYFKSGELTFPQPPSPRTPSLPSPPRDTNQGGGGVVDIGKKAAETDKAYRASKDKAYYASKDEEEKSVASIRDVIMANNDDDNNNNNNNNKTIKLLDRSVSRQSEDFSVKSFAFPILRNADKGGLQGSTPQKKPVISVEADGDGGLKKEEASKPVTPKAEADRGCNRYPSWLSCFPCCKTSYI